MQWRGKNQNRIERKAKKGFRILKKYESISNKEYQHLNNISKITATRDLKGLVEKRVLIPTGKGRRDLRYVFKWCKNDAKMMQK